MRHKQLKFTSNRDLGRARVGGHNTDLTSIGAKNSRLLKLPIVALTEYPTLSLQWKQQYMSISAAHKQEDK